MGLRDSTRPSNVCGTGKVALATLTVQVAWMVAYKPPRAPTNPWARAIAAGGYTTVWKKHHRLEKGLERIEYAVQSAQRAVYRSQSRRDRVVDR
jgi:hypothetical protein